jgi:hypothetical protein
MSFIKPAALQGNLPPVHQDEIWDHQIKLYRQARGVYFI